MSLVKIIEQDNLIIDLVYGTERNFTGKQIYQNPICYLHVDAAECLYRAIALSKPLGYGIKVFDAFRPMEAQNLLWNICPDPYYVANPHVGSNHSRGVAVDLTLIDKEGKEVDMGTGFDEFDERSHHCNQAVSSEAQRNRFILLGIMTAAGWDLYEYEWWHYQLRDVKQYCLLNDTVLENGMMDPQSHVL